jgi:hypothetical protein
MILVPKPIVNPPCREHGGAGIWCDVARRARLPTEAIVATGAACDGFLTRTMG